MANIIKEHFNEQEFIQQVNEFLYADTRVKLNFEKLKETELQMLKLSKPFLKIISSYFENKGNMRYEVMTRKMESFVKRYQKVALTFADLQQREVFCLFWMEISAVVQEDAHKLKDQYLTNSCNYFNYAINKAF